MKIAVVLPTHRSELFLAWLKAWQAQFDKHNVTVYFVEDADVKSDLGLEHHYYRADFPDFIPDRTGSCRSYGFLRAYQDGQDIIITLDDDCLPVPGVDLIQEYLDAFEQKYAVSNYFDVGHSFGLGEYMRGYPFNHRDKQYPMIQYGGWDNVPDMDAVTQMEHEVKGSVEGYQFDRRVAAIPKGLGFTGCIMNVAVKREAVPLLYQLIMGNDRVGYDRWDDIWSGLFAKRICDHLNVPILINGKASIKHTRASNTLTNLKKELHGYHYNEDLWQKLSNLKLSEGSYSELIDKLDPAWFGPEGQKIIDGMRQWINALSA